MVFTFKNLILAAALASSASAHGLLVDPAPRVPGPAFKAACGQQIYNMDKMGNVQQELQLAASQKDVTPDCNFWLCRGLMFEDNSNNVKKYTAGQVVPVKFEIEAPHPGSANVSIVDTATNSIIGTPLVTYPGPDFASNNGGIKPANETAFSITIPSDLGSKCSTAGACVIQHWWDSPSAKQTYESCIDFTV